MGKPIIVTREIEKVYGMDGFQVHALDGVSLEIDQGEFVAIMGPSGSGKSTLMNIIGCLDRPTNGSYHLNGAEVSSLNRTERARLRNRTIGFVFQSYNLLARTSALENVLLPLLYNEEHLPATAREARAKSALEAVGLAERIEHQPQELSGGQQQRVAIARALVNDPVLILADEPTGNLDSHSGEEIMAVLNGLHRQGRTIVMVTHDPDIAAHTERIVHMLDGKLEHETHNGNTGSRTEAAT